MLTKKEHQELKKLLISELKKDVSNTKDFNNVKEKLVNEIIRGFNIIDDAFHKVCSHHESADSFTELSLTTMAKFLTKHVKEIK